MLYKLAFILLASSIPLRAFTQAAPDIQAPSPHSAYLQDGQGIIVRTPHGLCWRSGYWTPADAVIGCDGELVPPILKAIAPDIVQPAEAAQPAPAATLKKTCDFAVTLNSSETFRFDRTVLSASAKKRLDAELASKLANCAQIDVFLITGHADRLGSQQYNQRLSEKRAEAVAAYLKSKGMAITIETQGAGASQPVQLCSDKLSQPQLIKCLAPNRRVVINVQGLAK